MARNHVNSRYLTWINPARAAFKRRQKEFVISEKQQRIARRERQAQELEANQSELRTSIAQSKRLVEEADAMIKRHRDECDAADGE